MTGSFDGRSQGEEGGSWAASCLEMSGSLSVVSTKSLSSMAPPINWGCLRVKSWPL